jgi:hypothetical protein
MNFYLDTPIPDPEYVCVKIFDIPDKFILEYNLLDQDRFVEAVTVFPKPASLPTIFFNYASLLKTTMNLPPRQAFGAPNGIPSNFA